MRASQTFHPNERYGSTDEQTAVELSKKNFLQAWSDYIEAVKKNTEITERSGTKEWFSLCKLADSFPQTTTPVEIRRSSRRA